MIFFTHWLTGFVVWLAIAWELDGWYWQAFVDAALWPAALPLMVLRKALS